MAMAAEDIEAGEAEEGQEEEKKEEENQEEESNDDGDEHEESAPVGSSDDSSVKVSIPISVVTITGLGLVVANGISAGTFTSLWDAVWNGNIGSTAKTDLAKLGAESLFVLIMSFLAEINNDVNNLVFALFVGLWIVWGVHNAPSLQKFADTVTSKG